MRWLITLLGGYTSDAFMQLDSEWNSMHNGVQHTNAQFVAALKQKHSDELNQASVQLQQTQEMLRQTELRLSKVEEERANASAGWTKAVKLVNEQQDQMEKNLAVATTFRAERDTMAIELGNLREACTKIEDERDDNYNLYMNAAQERDALKAKLSRPKKAKVTA